MSNQEIHIRNAIKSEFVPIGQLMVQVYSKLEGFPSQQEQPAYYRLLANIGDLTDQPGTELLVAVSNNQILGGVVYFSNMRHYGSGGKAPLEKNGAGFRLLAVDPGARGKGVGRALSEACIKKAYKQNQPQLIIHTTKSMQVAWAMYERLGFKRSPDLDFIQQDLPVYGFRLPLRPDWSAT